MEKKDWKQRLGSYDSWAMNESMFITIDGETIYTLDKLLDFIQQELDKAREEGYEECKKDMAVGVGLAVDTEFSKIVSKIASKLTTK